MNELKERLKRAELYLSVTKIWLEMVSRDVPEDLMESLYRFIIGFREYTEKRPIFGDGHRIIDNVPDGDSGGGSSGGSGSGESGQGNTTESGISGKHEYSNFQNSVDLDYLKSEEYKNKFKGITGNTKIDEQLYKQSKAMLTHRNGTDKEDMCLIDSRTGEIVGRQSNSKIDFGVDYNNSINNAIKDNPSYSLISIHNHPTNNPPTGSDFVSNGANRYKLGLVVTHSGKVFTYKVGDRIFTRDLFDSTVDKYRGLNYNLTEPDAIMRTLSDFKMQYGIEWSER